MTLQEAKEVLRSHRPGAPAGGDSELAAALRLVETNPQLAAWYEAQQHLHEKMRSGLRSIEPPPGLRERILVAARPAPRTIPVPLWRRHPVALALAAALLLLGLIAALWDRPNASEGFENFQARMVSEALRQYGMEIETNDMAQVRQFMAAHGAPADYQLTPGLASAELAGGAVLTWRSRPVAMVCFKQPNQELLWMFVMEAAGLPDPPPAKPDIAAVRDIRAASWSKDGKVYVLAGPADAEALRAYL